MNGCPIERCGVKVSVVATGVMAALLSACGKGDYSKVIAPDAYCEQKGGIVYEDPQYAQRGAVFCANGDHAHNPIIIP